jgi:pimeloyl-ACP methyl ester carboxylesterase
MGQQRAMLGRIDSRPGLVQISCPALLMCDREQAITPLAVHLELASAIAGAQLMVLDDCGHLSSFEQLERVSLLNTVLLRKSRTWSFFAHFLVEQNDY